MEGRADVTLRMADKDVTFQVEEEEEEPLQFTVVEPVACDDNVSLG